MGDLKCPSCGEPVPSDASRTTCPWCRSPLTGDLRAFDAGLAEPVAAQGGRYWALGAARVVAWLALAGYVICGLRLAGFRTGVEFWQLEATVPIPLVTQVTGLSIPVGVAGLACLLTAMALMSVGGIAFAGVALKTVRDSACRQAGTVSYACAGVAAVMLPGIWRLAFWSSQGLPPPLPH